MTVSAFIFNYGLYTVKDTIISKVRLNTFTRGKELPPVAVMHHSKPLYTFLEAANRLENDRSSSADWSVTMELETEVIVWS